MDWFLGSKRSTYTRVNTVTHSRHVSFIFITQWNVEEDNTIIRKLAKDKGKTHDKDGKTGKCTKKQDNELINSFQNYDSRRLLMFLYQGWYLHKEKETSFLTSCMAHFGLTVTSLVKSRHQHEAPLVQVVFTKEFFLYLTEWYPFFLSLGLFFIFFFQGLSSAFDFSMSKDFSINKELPCVNFVKCTM